MPTPPTKPTPPTPPTMNTTSTATSGDDSHSISSTTLNSTNSKKAETVKTTDNTKNADGSSFNSPTKTPSIEKPNSSVTDKNTAAPPAAPLGNYKESSTQMPTTPVSSTMKKSATSVGFGLLFSSILLISIAYTCLRLWKSKAKQQRTVLNYSTDTPKELLNLMNSSATTPPLPQTILRKNKTAAKIKSNFEVRI
jgi:hypothetical protein